MSKNHKSKYIGINDFKEIMISIKSPEEILKTSCGEVLKPETINYKTGKPEKDGLFCEKIFGPVKDWTCSCGAYVNSYNTNKKCERCGVMVTKSTVRRERYGHIELQFPVVHILFVKSNSSILSTLLNIPVKTLVEVSKLIEDNDVTMYVASNKVVFKFGRTVIYSRVIAGDFPKTSRMIPTKYPYELKVNASKFIDAMARVSLLSVERERIVKLSMNDDNVEISSKSEQIGSANESIDLYEYSGGRFNISFNVDYVSDAIKATQSEDVILAFAGEMNAFKITAPGDDTLVQIITPVRSYY